jgi:uncharacterized protein
MNNLIPALMKPDAYDEYVKNVRMVQTHISWIFLTGKYVYKIKKPVNFGFLNFTTLERRKVFCEKELELNKRLAEDMYLEVVPINQSNGKIKVKGPGEIIEYAVKMKEIGQEKMMSKQLEKNKVTLDTIEKISKILSDFHSRTKEINQKDTFDVIKFNWNENFEQTKSFVDIVIENEKFDYIESTINKFLIDNKNLFEQRNNEGKIRECHGDLHSGNIFITDKIYIFDAIEFNERFRFSDVASEVAFLSMDLDFNKREDLADYFVKKYIEYSDDTKLSKLLNFYKSYRAFVRGKVISFKLNDKSVSEKEKNESKELAKKYFDLSFDYTKRFNPKVVVMYGFTGTGKSNLSKLVGKKIKGKIIKSDAIRKELAGVSLTTHKFDNYNEGIYTNDFSEKTYKEMFNRTRELLEKGVSCVLDATFSKKKYRDEAAEIAKQYNSEFFILECICPENLIKERLEMRLKTKSVSDGRWEIYQEQKKNFEPIGEREKIHLIIDTSKKNSLDKIFI